MTQNFDANSTNVTEVRTNELTNIRTDERKGENYIPVGINAGGIITLLVNIVTKSDRAFKGDIKLHYTQNISDTTIHTDHFSFVCQFH